MVWRLQFRNKDGSGEWKDSCDCGGTPLPKFKSFGGAFAYFFCKHHAKRRPDLLEYRLTPEFSTKPKLVLFTPTPPVRQPGMWATVDGQYRAPARCRR